MKKKAVVLLAAALLLTAFFTACSKEQPSVQPDIKKVVVFNPEFEEITAEADGSYSINTFTSAQFDAAPASDAIVCLSDYSTKAVTNKAVLSWQIKQTDNGYILQGSKIPDELKDKDVLYIAFSDTAVLFVNGELDTKQLFESMSLKTDIPFTFTAADGFSWATLDGEDTMGCVIMSVDGSVNVKVPSLKNGGSVRDCIYFVPEHTPGAASAVIG